MPNRFPNATHLMIEADCGGSNGYRSRVWKRDLQEKVVDALGLSVTVCHYPTGTSKWNPIEHRISIVRSVIRAAKRG
jgi:threonine aldolase